MMQNKTGRWSTRPWSQCCLAALSIINLLEKTVEEISDKRVREIEYDEILYDEEQLLATKKKIT